MKTFPAFSIGNYQMTATADTRGDGVIVVTVTCGNDSHALPMFHDGPFDYGADSFAADVRALIQRVATELAGKIRSRELAKTFVAS